MSNNEKVPLSPAMPQTRQLKPQLAANRRKTVSV